MTAELPRARRRILALASELESRAIAHALQPLMQTDISIQQLKVLTAVAGAGAGAGADDGLTVSAIADDLQVSLATASGLIRRLHEHGLVRRSSDDDDGRHRRVIATDLGKAAVRRLMGARPEFGSDVVAGLSDEDASIVERALSIILTAFPPTERGTPAIG